MSSGNHHNNNLTFSKEIMSLLTSLNEVPSSDNVKCLDEYLIRYLRDISENLYELYNYREDVGYSLGGSEVITKKKVKRKVKIDDLKFIFRNDSEKLSRLTELSDLAIQRDILQKQINAPENFSMLGSYGDGAVDNVGGAKASDNSKGKKRKLSNGDEEEEEEDDDEEEEEDDDDDDGYKIFTNKTGGSKTANNDRNEAKNGKLLSSKKDSPKKTLKKNGSKKIKGT
ncbi:hypothetical protein QEN19_003537 [Hanseniaspora menglaensis]